MSKANSSFTVRSYTGEADLLSMQAALAGWIHECGSADYCHIGDLPHRIYNGLRGRYPRGDMIRLWYIDGRLVGFALVYPRHTSYDAMISPEFRAGELEIEALRWAGDTLRTWMDRDGAHDQPVTTDAFVNDTARAKCLIELGYQPDASAWITTNERTISSALPDITLPEGFKIRSATDEGDAAGLAAVHNGAFKPNWTADLYRNEVMLKPGYHPSREHVVVAPDNTFAAFCITWLDATNGIGLFEPVGTHRDYQRQGLGRALMAHGLHFMHRNGMHIAQVGSTADNPASNALYRAMGFEPKYPFVMFRKRMSHDARTTTAQEPR